MASPLTMVHRPMNLYKNTVSRSSLKNSSVLFSKQQRFNFQNKQFQRSLPSRQRKGLKGRMSITTKQQPLLPERTLFKRKLENLEDTGIDDILDMPRKRKCVLTPKRRIDAYEHRIKVAKDAKANRQKRKSARNVNGSWSGLGHRAECQQGMSNPNILCYRNSLLQAVLHQPKLVNWFVQNHGPDDCCVESGTRCLNCLVKRVIEEYWIGKDSEFSKILSTLDTSFKKAGWVVGGNNGQGDPDELANWLFGVLRDELPTTGRSSLDSLMYITTASVVTCAKCGHISRSTDHKDRVLSIPIKPRIQKGAVSSYLTKYMIETVEDYKCESCSDKSDKTRRILISHAPDVLAVQLKRFEWNGAKDSAMVGINLTLDLDLYSEAKATEPQRMTYRLNSVVKHAGNSGFGHYICSALGPDNKWYTFDDQGVSRSSVIDATQQRGKFTPYLLFYQRDEA
ncbi:hypothetical protein B0O99DRAFT_596566 [Bisporella sp. PMI_857]|nr:hypothetical protein B0O99DRAFT_596566 [Bisporella sp. PMI_857]